jgi:ABC-type transport system substrate-binding protein
MQPLPMNEFVQDNLKDCWFDVNFDTMDWEALRARRRGGVDMPENKGADALNNSWSFADPDIGLITAAWSVMKPPRGVNWGDYSDPVADDLAARAKVAFDVAHAKPVAGAIARPHRRSSHVGMGGARPQSPGARA